MLDKVIDAASWVFRVFSERAKVRISCKTGGAMSLAGPTHSVLTLRWDYTITLANLAKHDALELEVVETNNPQLTSLPAYHIKELEALEVPLRFSKDVDRDRVTAAAHDFWGKLQPTEIGQMRVLLAYKNLKGIRSYTLYQRVDGNDRNEYYRRRPKNDAA